MTTLPLITALLLCLSAVTPDVHVKTHVKLNLHETMASVLSRLSDLEKQNDRLVQDNLRMAQEMARQAQEMADQVQENSRQAEEIKSLKSATLPTDVNTAIDVRQTKTPDTRSQFTAVACTSSIMNITCNTNKAIFITSGTYGQYDFACSDGCCPPNPELDCTELVKENSPQDWAVIKALCDNQSSCEFENPGAVVNECEEGYLSDYMQLFYDCLPDDETGPVAFTAWANTGSPTEYVFGEVIMFNEVISNFGGHYNPTTSSFICPVDGVYLFSVSMLPYISVNIVVNLMRNNTVLSRAHGDDVSGSFNPVSTTVVTECSRGEPMWVNVYSSGSIYASNQYCVFTGHLIQRL